MQQQGSIALSTVALSTGKDNVYDVLVSVKPPEGVSRTPANICCVVDVSGSMNTEATMKNAAGETEGHGLTMLDIVKHAVKTIVATLNEHDQLAVVSYSSKAATVFSLQAMDTSAKQVVNDALSKLRPSGSTNLWDGLLTGLEILRQEEQKHSGSGRYNSVILLTDGLPNVSPPRGEVSALKDYNDQHPNLACTINTFGFGYNINSELLVNLALAGRGMFGFIPDSSFVGTAFVHSISNTLSTTARDTMLSLEPLNGAKILEKGVLGNHIVNYTSWGASVNLCSLNFGQSKDIVVRMSIPQPSAPYLAATVEFIQISNGETNNAAIESNETTQVSIEVELHRSRSLFIEGVQEAFDFMKKQQDTHASQRIERLVHTLTEATSAETQRDPRFVALLEDLQGQVTEALSKRQYFTKWGVHYLPSLLRAHQIQQCNNFKDPGIQFYGGKLFGTLRDEADDIFVKLPPPESTSYSSSSSGYSAPISSMSVYHSCSNPCFAGGCSVLLAGGIQKKVSEVTKGDKVVTSTTTLHTAEVVCVVKTKCERSRAALVELPGGLVVTPYHPVRKEGEAKWSFPCTLAEAREEECKAVYSFVLRQGHTMIIEGMQCVTLGHGFTGDNVVRHAYFGSKKVVEDLQRMKGWTEGLVELEPGCVVRDTTSGLVCGLTQKVTKRDQQQPSKETCLVNSKQESVAF